MRDRPPQKPVVVHLGKNKSRVETEESKQPTKKTKELSHTEQKAMMPTENNTQDPRCSGSFVAPTMVASESYPLLASRIRTSPVFLLIQLFLTSRDALRKEVKEQFSSLGNYSEEHNRLFDRSPSTIECAQRFSSYFFENEENRAIVIDNHRNKLKFNAQNHINVTSPRCVSFITGTLFDKKYCFVAISSNNVKSEINKALKTAVAQFNELKITPHTFVLLNNSNCSYFAQTIETLTQELRVQGDYNPLKPCSEQLVNIVLKELFKKYGKHLFIEGIENTLFYPYEVGRVYGTKETMISSPNSRLPLTKGLYLGTIGCCENCIVGKFASLIILKDAQIYGEKFLNERYPVLDHPTPEPTDPDLEKFENESGATGKAASIYLTKIGLTFTTKGITPEENQKQASEFLKFVSFR